MNSEDDAFETAVHDSLTGLFNQAYFQREAENTMRRAIRSQNAFSLLLISLIHLDKVRTVSGTDAANRVQVAMSNALRMTLRSTDVIARAENDQLLVLLPDTGGLNAELVAGKLVEPMTLAGSNQEPHVSFAVGIATYPENAADTPSLFARAREAHAAALEGELPSVVRSVLATPMPAPDWVLRQLSRGANDSLTARRKTAETADAWERLPIANAETPLREAEWKTIIGAWRTDGDEWISVGGESSVLVSKVPITGSFHFVCEGWNEGLSEISIIGHAYEGKNAAHWGYSLHVGADVNTCTKFNRLGQTVMVLPDCSIEPQRRYRLEMHYDEGEGKVTCFLDGQRLFVYNERLPFPGFQIGLYAWLPGAHLKPLEIHCPKNRRLAAMHVADEYFQDGSFEFARQCYTAISNSCATSTEVAQARLKGAICLSSMNRPDDARLEMQAIRGTELEPYALAQEAALNFKTGQVQSGLELFEDVFRRFPDSPARTLVLGNVSLSRSREFRYDASRKNDLDVRGRLNRMGQETCTPPSYAQIRSAIEWARIKWQLGEWTASLDNLLLFQQRLVPSQYDVADFRLTLIVSALANGRDDLLSAEPSISQIWSCGWAPDWYSGILLHAVVRKSDPARFIDEYLAAAKEYPQINQERDLRNGVLLLYLAQNRLPEASEFLRSQIIPNMKSLDSSADYFGYFFVGGALVESGEESLVNEFLELLRALSAKDAPRSQMARSLSLLKTRWAIEHGDFDAAAAAIDGWSPPELVFHFSEGLVLQALLSSLKVLKSPSRDELIASLDGRLAGTELELANIFLRDKEPRPNELWPHAGWRPEFRVWLGRWLNAKGNADAARAVAQPAVDPRYGRTHSQPALAALLHSHENMAARH